MNPFWLLQKSILIHPLAAVLGVAVFAMLMAVMHVALLEFTTLCSEGEVSPPGLQLYYCPTSQFWCVGWRRLSPSSPLRTRLQTLHQPSGCHLLSGPARNSQHQRRGNLRRTGRHLQQMLRVRCKALDANFAHAGLIKRIMSSRYDCHLPQVPEYSRLMLYIHIDNLDPDSQPEQARDQEGFLMLLCSEHALDAVAQARHQRPQCRWRPSGRSTQWSRALNPALLCLLRYPIS